MIKVAIISLGCNKNLVDSEVMAGYLKKSGYAPEQVQDFYPTPGTVSTTMFYTGIDPLSGKKALLRMQRWKQ